MCNAPGGKILNIRACDLDPGEHLILHELAWAYEFFHGCFSLVDNNYTKNSIFQNAAFIRSKFDKMPLDVNFFGKRFYNENKVAIRELTYESCFIDSNFKSINDFTACGLPFPVTVWMNLRSSLIYARKILGQSNQQNITGSTVSMFVNKFKKGSKHFRIIIEKATYIGNSCLDLNIVKSFARITNTTVPEEQSVRKILSSWNNHYLENGLREFLFNCRHNILRTEDRKSHFYGTDGRCFFCKNMNPPLNNKESFHHLFFTCPLTNTILNRTLIAYNIIFAEPNVNFNVVYWYGTINQSLCLPTLFFFDTFRFCLWNFKIRKKIPRTESFMEMLTTVFSSVFLTNKKLRKKFDNVPHFNNFLQALG
jgi:hypothetical protein